MSLYAGLALSFFTFGTSTAEVAVFGLASYAAMALYRPACGYIVFAGSFGYLIYIHATSASGEAWKAGPSSRSLFQLALEPFAPDPT